MKLRLLPLVLALASVAAAQTPVDITAEPHHHLLLENGDVRVFALTLRPMQQAVVRHEHNFLMVSLTDGELVMWGEGASALPNFRFYKGEANFCFAGPFTGLRNDRTTAYRGVIVEFLNPKVSPPYRYISDEQGWGYVTGGVNPPSDPHAKFVDNLPLGAASASDVQLLAGDSYPAPEKPAEELVIPISDLELEAGQDQTIQKSPGQVLWIPEGRKSGFSNAGRSPARFIMVTLPAP
jgi:hypothetical protein